MKKRLLDKFVRMHGWFLVGLLATVRVVAGVQPIPDSCRHPEPPVIVGAVHVICRSETVALSATGCAGTVVWSNGETGDRITIQPQQTTTYTAICRARQGCISCFADGWKITVNTPVGPTVTPSTALVCAGDAVLLTATNCAGTVRWSAQGEAISITGLSWTDRPRQTTAYRATCEQNSCISSPSATALIQTATPSIPIIAADKSELCAGQAVRLTASGCIGTVRWSDGGSGIVRSVSPDHTATYRAICQIGSCRSDSSGEVLVTVRPAMQLPMLATTLTNGCPFQTADLSKTIPEDESATSFIDQYLFRTKSLPDGPAVQSPGAVTDGTYYIFGRSAEGCYTEPVAVVVSIHPCKNAIPACLSNPAALVARLDTLDWAKGVVRLRGQLSGSATEAKWQSSGDGLLADSGLNVRYLLSEGDRQRGAATFTLSSPDPDGAGPCVGASSQIVVAAPAGLREVVGLNEKPGVAPVTLPQSETGETVFIPEGFSPNNDGINDRFVIGRVPAGITIQLEIFNRWGQVVYQNNEYRNDWEGTANRGVSVDGTDRNLPDGTYYYQIHLSDGRDFTRFLTLIR